MTVVLVVGPPCSGKTTFVDRNRADADVVIDFDVIARELGSPDEWRHADPYKTAAIVETDRRIAEVDGATGTTWVIRCLPDRQRRRDLAAELGAEVVLLDPGLAVCLARANARPSGTRKSIRLWYWTDGRT